MVMQALGRLVYKEPPPSANKGREVGHQQLLLAPAQAPVSLIATCVATCRDDDVRRLLAGLRRQRCTRSHRPALRRAGVEVHRLLLLCPFQAKPALQLDAAPGSRALDGCLL